jgi:exodeoxyribonuclease V alpha subunit
MKLAELRSRGLLELLDTELARALGRAGGEDPGSTVELAVALTSRNVRNGHACLPLDIHSAALWPGEPLEGVSLPDARSWAKALRESQLTQTGPLVLDEDGRLYLRRYWQFENDIAEQLARRAPELDDAPSGDFERRLERLFPDGAQSLQADAARNALRHRVSLLCGGPGTGKTTTVAGILALLVEEAEARGEGPPKTLLLAPTGKAAARLGEAVQTAKTRIKTTAAVLDAIPVEASTLQRALGMRPDGLRFSRDEERPLEAHVVVVDEASMIDLSLMRQLLEATPRNARLLIVGDPGQLTSVEAGSVLQDLVTASQRTWWEGRLTTLERTHRYDASQPLGQLIAAIGAGDVDAVAALLSEADTDDLRWSPSSQLESELDVASARWSSATSEPAPTEHFARRSKYVVLSPFRKGPTGTRRLGALIEKRLIAGGKVPAARPILIEENSRELRVYNGDLAFIRAGDTPMAVIPTEHDEPREIAEARLPRYSDAYALSIHKSQGSEFDEVLIVLPEEDAPLLTRELLYTAVSRARRKVRLVAPQDVVLRTVARQARRDSGLVGQIARRG